MLQACFFMVCMVFVTAQYTSAQVVTDFCSQAYEIHKHCASLGTGPEPNVKVIEGRIGKSGPRGPAGLPGIPGTVNYTQVNEIILKKFEVIEARIDEKLSKYEKLLNRTAENENKIAELQKALSVRDQADCQRISRENAEVWNGTGGVFDLYFGFEKMRVYCDLATDGGGWTVFQRRMNGSTSFNQDWEHYVNGFGNRAGEFWLGLENLHRLTQGGEFELRVDMTDLDGNPAYAKYGIFSVGGRSDKYRLTVGDYFGDAGDSLSYHNGMAFSTPEVDNDSWNDHCAKYLRGGWWFQSCQHSNLNGDYHNTDSTPAGSLGVMWYHWKGNNYSLKSAEMKIRKIGTFQ